VAVLDELLVVVETVLTPVLLPVELLENVEPEPEVLLVRPVAVWLVAAAS
jgi:hypothetical protein